MLFEKITDNPEDYTIIFNNNIDEIVNEIVRVFNAPVYEKHDRYTTRMETLIEVKPEVLKSTFNAVKNRLSYLPFEFDIVIDIATTNPSLAILPLPLFDFKSKSLDEFVEDILRVQKKLKEENYHYTVTPKIRVMYWRGYDLSVYSPNVNFNEIRIIS
jgi:uncharacterized protein YqgV (UPF0045/DUF77 family)